METRALILSIDSELALLRQARALLAGTSNGRAPQVHKKHVMSAEGRARIAAAQRKRWAKLKRAAKKAA
jgi:hypothetical protein